MKHLPVEFWARFNKDTASPTFMQLGEYLDGAPSRVAARWQAGHFTSMFDFPLAFAIVDVFCKGASPAKLGATLSNDRRYPDPSQLVTLVDNHDLPRLMSACGGDATKAGDALSFLFSTRGLPSMTWGTEVGQVGEKEPENRASMRFVPGPKPVAEALEMLGFRNTQPALRDGASTVLFADESTLVVGRATPGQLAVVFVTSAPRAIPSLPKPWSAFQGGPSSTVTCRGRIEGAQLQSRVVACVAASRDDALVRVTQSQWRTGSVVKEVTIDGAMGTFVTGSSAELGDWQVDRALPLPAKVKLPVNAVFTFKRFERTAAGVRWADGPDSVLFVAP